MALSDDIRNQIQSIENNLNPTHYSASSEAGQGGNLGSRWANAQNQTCFNSRMCASKAAEFQSLGSQINAAKEQIIKLKDQLQTQLQIELSQPVEKVIPNNEIIGPDLVPAQTTAPGQVSKIPILPIAAGVGIIILVVALSKRKRK